MIVGPVLLYIHEGTVFAVIYGAPQPKSRGAFIFRGAFGGEITVMTPKQQCFVDEYLIDLNATQAAIRAGYSPRTANEQGARLLANVSVKNAIDIALAERSRRTGVSQDRIVNELAKIAFANAADIIDFGAAEVREGAGRDDTACIASVKVKVVPAFAPGGQDGVEREIKTYDKTKALELLMRHIGMFKDSYKLDVALPVVISGSDRLED